MSLDIRIRREADGGEPPVVSDRESPVALKYREIVRQAVSRFASGPRDHKGAFPKIVVENAR